jgi:hypothetical protein
MPRRGRCNCRTGLRIGSVLTGRSSRYRRRLSADAPPSARPWRRRPAPGSMQLTVMLAKPSLVSAAAAVVKIQAVYGLWRVIGCCLRAFVSAMRRSVFNRLLAVLWRDWSCAVGAPAPKSPGGSRRSSVVSLRPLGCVSANRSGLPRQHTEDTCCVGLTHPRVRRRHFMRVGPLSGDSAIVIDRRALCWPIPNRSLPTHRQ